MQEELSRQSAEIGINFARGRNFDHQVDSPISFHKKVKALDKANDEDRMADMDTDISGTKS